MPEPKIGDKAKCASCGDSITWTGKYWDHDGPTPRHPGTPTTAAASADALLKELDKTRPVGIGEPVSAAAPCLIFTRGCGLRFPKGGSISIVDGRLHFDSDVEVLNEKGEPVTFISGGA